MVNEPTSPAVSDFPAVIKLADRQLAAYNAADLDAFCDCYADDVVVLDADGVVTMRGMKDFRARYGDLFARFTEVKAAIRGRLSLGAHQIELEIASRIDRATSQQSRFELIVRYTEKSGRIATVQFLR